MEILSPHSFKSVNGVTVTCSVDEGKYFHSRKGTAYLRFSGPYQASYNDFPVCFYPDEVEAMQTLLAGGELSMTPKFKEGDILRLRPGAATIARPGSLARVTSGLTGAEIYGKPLVNVEWIDDRSDTQNHGGYFVKEFDLVDPADLTEEDYASMGRRNFKKLTRQV